MRSSSMRTNMRTKILKILLILVFGTQSVSALTGWQVARRAVGLGLLSGVGAYWYWLPGSGNPFPLKRKGDASDGLSLSSYEWNSGAKDSCKAFLGCGIGTTVISGWILSYWTATSRYKWARSHITNLEKQGLYNAVMTSESINRILQNTGCEYTELPFVEAFLRLRSYDETLRSVEDQLIQALEDAGRYSHLGEKIEKLLKQVRNDLRRVRENETFVKNHDKKAWYEQWKVYERRELERERFRREALIHSAPQVHSHVVYHWR